jgi:hypothetical protein
MENIMSATILNGTAPILTWFTAEEMGQWTQPETLEAFKKALWAAEMNVQRHCERKLEGDPKATRERFCFLSANRDRAQKALDNYRMRANDWSDFPEGPASLLEEGTSVRCFWKD